MKKIISYLFGAFLFTFPFAVRWVVYERASYRFGQFNPWVAGFVHGPELLLGAAFLLWVIRKFRARESWPINGWLWGIFGLFALNAYGVTLFYGDSMLGAFFVLRLVEAVMVFALLTDHLLPIRRVVALLLLGALFQIAVGFFQWHNNSSIGLKWLGESVIGPQMLGVAKIDLADGAKQVRAYGLLPHPNILAAYLLIVFWLSVGYLKKGSWLLWAGVFAFGLYLTHSRAALAVGLMGVGLYALFSVVQNVKFRRLFALAILLCLIIVNGWLFNNGHTIPSDDPAIKERLSQNVISRNMFAEYPFGVGVGNFTLEIERFSDCISSSEIASPCAPRKYLPWEFQPVHNTYFLILNETGAQGLALLTAFLFLLFGFYWKAGKAVPLFSLMLLAPFDHLLWDSFAGLVLISLSAGFFVLENHKEGVVEYLVNVVTHHDEQEN